MIEEEHERIHLWDNIKAAMIVLVVLGHFIDPYTQESPTCQSLFVFIYSFHMPLFLFMSGLFYRNDNIRNKTIYFISIGLALKIVEALTFLLKFPPSIPEFNLFSDSGLPWFMFVEAAFLVLTFALKDVDRRFVLVVSVLIACLAGYDHSLGDFLYISRIVVFYPFYIAGVMMKNRIKSFINFKESNSLACFIIGITVLIIWVYVCFKYLNVIYNYRHLFTGRNPFSSEVISYGFFARLFAYFVTIVTSLSVILITPNKKISYFTDFGTKTINVFFWHYVLLKLICNYVDFFQYFENKKVLIIFIVLIECIMIYRIPFFEYPIKYIKKCCLKE